MPASILVPLAARSALTAWAVLSFAAADGPSGAVIFAIAACFYIEELGHRRVERIIASHQEPPAVTPPPANISFVTLLVFAMHAALLAVLAYRAVVPVADTAVFGFIAALFGPPSYKQFGKTLKDQEVRRALTALADDTDDEVRLCVAGNPNTPADTLTALANDTRPDVRAAVAANTSTPYATLAVLAADPNAWVRLCVAVKQATPPETLTALAADPNWKVRQRVADNPRTPPEALRSLAVDKDPDVREEARANPACPDLTGAERTHGGLLAD